MESLRPLLITYAYNILGSVDEAKDVVQDAFLKFIEKDNAAIENQKAYLVRSVINLSINQKKRQRKLVANYPGQWLPEPVATEFADNAINRKEILSYSLMVLLEKLNPKQRAVFILKEGFNYDHEEIAEVLDITVENSRKLLSRSKALLQEAQPVEEKTVSLDYLNKYMHVIHAGDMQGLERLLTDEITVISDGGGKVTAFMKPVKGRESVVALLMGITKKFYHHIRLEQKWINHQPALFYYDDDKLVNCQVFSITNGHIDKIYFMRNPDKLKELENIS
jgi:RNA polymerase sigma-70 factor (ECF subfamily)